MMVSLNVQIYFHKAGETASRLPGTYKKRAFLKGLLSDIIDVEAFKKFVMQYGMFDITSINGTTYTSSDGSQHTATFMPKIRQADLPDGEVFCGLLIVSGLPIDEHRIHYLLQVGPDDVPVETMVEQKVDAKVNIAMKTLVDLYGKVAEKILDDIGDEQLSAIETLETYLKEVQL